MDCLGAEDAGAGGDGAMKDSENQSAYLGLSSASFFPSDEENYLKSRKK